MSCQHLLAYVTLDVIDTVCILRHIRYQSHEDIQRVIGFVVLRTDVTKQVSGVTGQCRSSDVGSG